MGKGECFLLPAHVVARYSHVGSAIRGAAEWLCKIMLYDHSDPDMTQGDGNLASSNGEGCCCGLLG